MQKEIQISTLEMINRTKEDIHSQIMIALEEGRNTHDDLLIANKRQKEMYHNIEEVKAKLQKEVKNLNTLLKKEQA